MLKTRLMPLRNTVGNPVTITSVEIIGAASGLATQNI